MTFTFDILDEIRKAGPSGVQKPPADQIEKMAEQIIDSLKVHPLFDRYAAHLDGPQPVRNTQAWQAKGEQLTAVIWLCGAELGRTPRPTGHDNQPLVDIDGRPEGEPLRLAMQALTAIPYLWRSDMVELARAAPLPKRFVIARDMLPGPFMFWSFETSYDMKDTAGKIKDDSYDWMLLSDEGQAVSCTFGGGDKGNIRTGGLRYGMCWPDDFEQPEAVEFYLRMCFFLSSNVTVPGGERYPRYIRRVLHRAGRQNEEEDLIRVVKLRRQVQASVDAYEAADREYRHRWWVSGHYRAQWYPSLNSHKVIWIAPFLKGPEGAPMLERIYDVAR